MEWFVFDSCAWNHLTFNKQMRHCSFKNLTYERFTYKFCLSVYLPMKMLSVHLLYIYIYIYHHHHSCFHAASTDIPDPLTPLLPIIHRFWQVFGATSRILTSLLYVCSNWSSCFCLAICAGPYEYMTDEFVLAFPAVSCVSGSSNLYSFRDGRQVAV